MLNAPRRRSVAAIIAIGASAALFLGACQSPASVDSADDTTSGGAATGAPQDGGEVLSAESCESVDGPSGAEGATAGESPSDEDQESAAEAEEDLAANPETATTGFRDGMNPVKTTNFSVSTANPLSTKALCDVLADGGTAAALGELHDQQASTEWSDLVGPAETMASDGFDISPRLSASIEEAAEDLARDPDAAAYFLDEDGEAKQSGETPQNPDYAATLNSLAEGGVDALYTGDLARSIVERANSREGGTTPGQLSTADLAAYTPETHDAVCTPYRDKTVCGMGPSSSGGITVASALGILGNTDLEQYAPEDAGAGGFVPDPEAVHVISEAERLAYADRDAYVADTAFAPLPGPDGESADAMLDPGYLEGRYDKIDPDTSMGEAEPGELSPVVAQGADQPENGTSHISVVDGDGNAASMTTSVEAAFGSFHMVGGFMLNNQLTDFSEDPEDEAGNPVANSVEGGKRPRSSMAPTMVFNGADNGDATTPGDLYMVAGSPGGAVIPQYVLETLIGVIDWGLDPQQAVSMPNFGARNEEETGIGGEHPLIGDDGEGSGGSSEDVENLVSSLEDKGHEVSTEGQVSGLSAIVRQDDGTLIGGADPRREGVILGG